MFGYLAAGIVGVAIGVSIMLIIKHDVDVAVKEADAKSGKKIRELEDKLNAMRKTCDRLQGDRGWEDGYERGYYDGIERGKNMSESEKLEHTLSNGGHRKTKIGGAAY